MMESSPVFVERKSVFYLQDKGASLSQRCIMEWNRLLFIDTFPNQDYIEEFSAMIEYFDIYYSVKGVLWN